MSGVTASIETHGGAATSAPNPGPKHCDPLNPDYGMQTQFFFLVMGAFVFFMQAGFALLEAGSVRSSTATSILFKNLGDVYIGAIMWWAVGYAWAYGSTTEGDFIGSSGDEYFLNNVSFCSYSDWFFQWTFAATAATIVSGAMAGRTQLTAYLVYSAVLSGFIYPVVVHWTWNSSNAWLADKGYSDFAGSGIVHVTGGIAALMGCTIVGPRLEFTDAVDRDDIPGHSTVLQALGTFILIFGFFGFNGGSVLSFESTEDTGLISLAIVNTVLACAGGGVTSTMLWWFKTRKWSLGMACNGAIAGMVAVCAGADAMFPWAAHLTGAIGALFFFGTSRLLKRVGIDDAIDAVGVHAGAGLAGLICKPFFTFNDGIVYGASTDHGFDAGKMLGWNLLGFIIIASWVAATTGALFATLRRVDLLRIDGESLRADHDGKQSLDEMKHGERAYVMNISAKDPSSF